MYLQVNKKTLLDWKNKSRTLHLQSVTKEGRPNLLYRYRRAVSSGPEFLTKFSLSTATANSNRFTVDIAQLLYVRNVDQAQYLMMDRRSMANISTAICFFSPGHPLRLH